MFRVDLTGKHSMRSCDEYCTCHPDAPECAPLWKAAEATDEERLIEGLASLDIRDEQGDIVHPDKLDLTYLAKKGKINWHHGRDPADQIGVVTDYKVGRVRDVVPKKYHGRLRKRLDNVCLWITGRLKRGLKKAEDVWKDISNNPSPDDHGLGFSVQGRATRENRHVVSGYVSAIALTHAPVLADTFVRRLEKALATSYQHSDQTGGMATVPEQLRRNLISTTFHGPYGDSNLRDGFSVTTAGSSRRLRGADGSVRMAAVPRTALMPLAGDDVRIEIGDV